MIQEEIEKQAEKYIKTVRTEWENETHWVDCSDERKDSWIDGAKWGIANAIKWHDLREDPNDLPKKCGRYWGYVDYYGLQHREILWENNQFDVTGVIAWCELPQFKDKE